MRKIFRTLAVTAAITMGMAGAVEGRLVIHSRNPRLRQ